MEAMGILAELKRRHVFRVSLAYAAVAWLLIEVSATTFPMLRLPDWSPTLVLVLLLVGFPFAVIFAWIYEITPEGLKRDIGGSETAGDRRTSPGAPVAEAVSEQSIAVLPFVNMSDDASNEYFSDGLSEELLNLLARIPQLHVAARTSSFSFKGEKIDIPTVAAKLNVANVLEGSVRKAGNRIRITAQLVKAANGYHLWSETYDRSLDDIFAIQDEIAGAVVEGLKVRLLGEVPRVRETEPEAYTLYLQGMYFVTSGQSSRFDRAVRAFKQALDLDSEYAPAWAGLAHTYWYQISYGLLKKADGIVLALDACDRALALDDSLAEAHAVKGLLSLSFALDWSTAEFSIGRALELAPGSAAVVLQAGNLAKTQGHFEKANTYLRQAISLDPLNTTGHIWLSMVMIAQGHLDQAQDILDEVLNLNTKRAVAHQQLGRIHLLRGDPVAAHAEMQKEPAGYWRDFGMSLSLYALDRREEADAAFQHLMETYPDEGPFQNAEIYAFRGEIDNAFRLLERAYEIRDNGVTELLTSQFLIPLHGDPRWRVFLNKVGAPLPPT